MERLTLELAVDGMDTAESFYCDLLGFEVARRDVGFLVLSRGEVELMLSSWHDETDAVGKTLGDDRGAGIEIVLVTSNVESLYETLKDGDARIVMDLQERPWQARDLHVLDPFGYHWRISSPRGLHGEA